MTPTEEAEFNRAYAQMVSWLNEHLEARRHQMVKLAHEKGTQGYTVTQYAIMSFTGASALFLQEIYEGKHNTDKTGE